MRVHNSHQRCLPADAAAVGALIDSLASPADQLWPGTTWPPMRLDRGLCEGARGGHGPVRYRVVEYSARRRAVFEFESQGASRGFAGRHWFEVTSAGSGSVLRHVIEMQTRGAATLRWLVALRPLHDALLEDALDRAELAVTGRVQAPARWSAWVRLLRHALRPRTAHPLQTGAGTDRR